MNEMQKKTFNKKPWGHFEQFTHNELSTVKLITVESNAKLSLQYHHKRDEFWRIVSGQGTVRIGDDVHHASVGDEFFIERGTLHRIMTEDVTLQVLEISYGMFDEEDIVRVEDSYGRV